MIVFAAIKKDDLIIIGKRHFDNTMRDKIKELKETHVGFQQGFINQKNEFLTREEAAIEAMECGQVVKGHANIKHVFNGYKLYSEDYI